MYTISDMPNKTKVRTYSFRLTEAEAERFERIGLIYSARNAFAKKSDLIRAWLDVDRDIQENAKLTKEEREFLSGLRDTLPATETKPRKLKPTG